MIGKHLLVNIKNIRDKNKLKFINIIKPLFSEIIHVFKLNVANWCSKQFTPYGVTLLYLLSESHLSCHTFVDEGILSMDLFTCNLEQGIDQGELCKMLRSFFDEDIVIEIDLILR